MRILRDAAVLTVLGPMATWYAWRCRNEEDPWVYRRKSVWGNVLVVCWWLLLAATALTDWGAARKIIWAWLWD